ncbi:MAG: DUF2306 domain-containing protein [Anaerolineae bacterium]|nr:DUF2306 domain-containing protein [Anaerolineae bacterium]
MNANVRQKPTALGLKNVSNQQRFILFGLLVLCLIPVLAGGARLTELSIGADVTRENARFFASPLPVVIHIISVTLYTILGAFQFIKGTRRWKPRLHQKLGRYLLLPAGLAAAISGIWMTLFYDLPSLDGVVLNIMRLIFGTLMVVYLALAYLAVRQRDYKQHGVWMLRAYAIGMGAGTQVLTNIVGLILLGELDVFSRAVVMGAGWVINVLVAEWIIHRQRSELNRQVRPSMAQ